MKSTCYVVGTLDTATGRVTGVKFYSAEAKHLTTTGDGEFFFDIIDIPGRTYHNACVRAYEYLMGTMCPTYMRWVRPWITGERKAL